MKSLEKFYGIRNILFIFTLFLLIGSCGVNKRKLTGKGGEHEAIMNAILDFSKTSRLYLKYDVFSVTSYYPFHRIILDSTLEGEYHWRDGKAYEGIIAVSIFPTKTVAIVLDSVKMEKGEKDFNYYIKNKKLFYWEDSTRVLRPETISTFRKYDLVVENDYDGIMTFFDRSLSTRKALHYFFCEDDLTSYKKVKKDIAIGYYDPPLPICAQ
ncbi:MAG: hypothetical protein AAF554_11060 [Bacteroidota bacterium]